MVIVYLSFFFFHCTFPSLTLGTTAKLRNLPFPIPEMGKSPRIQPQSTNAPCDFTWEASLCFASFLFLDPPMEVFAGLKNLGQWMCGGQSRWAHLLTASCLGSRPACLLQLASLRHLSKPAPVFGVPWHENAFSSLLFFQSFSYFSRPYIYLIAHSHCHSSHFSFQECLSVDLLLAITLYLSLYAVIMIIFTPSALRF